jgi:hypothetical protein
VGIQNYKVAVNLFTKLISILETKVDMPMSEEESERAKQEHTCLLSMQTSLAANENSIPPPKHSYISLLGQAIGPILKNAFSLWHPDSNLYGRITLCESGILKHLGGSGKIQIDALLDEKKAIESFLRTVSCFNLQLESNLIGNITANNEGPDYQSLNLRSPVKITNPKDAIFTNDILISNIASSISSADIFSFLAVPIDSDPLGYEGTIDIVLTGKDAKLKDGDITFILNVARLVIESIKRINAKNVTHQLILSAKAYSEIKSNLVVEAYIGEDGFQKKSNEAPIILKIDQTNDDIVWQGSKYLNSVSALHVLPKDNALYAIIERVLNTGKSEMINRHALVAIIDPDSEICIAVLSVKELDANLQIAETQFQEISNQMKLLETAVDKLAHNRMDLSGILGFRFVNV